ncbi:hypothetical protein [Noviherbaspirillum aerium]|uniref:hypothetical protein n=1 Tax=Noviherbaspirillum aerium TaxID=2588497 RepID=UPI00124BD742|nr:hypothetical protein [Noviherbaspirillum aerium]
MKTDEFRRKAEERGAYAVYMNSRQRGKFTGNELQSRARSPRRQTSRLNIPLVKLRCRSAQCRLREYWQK